MSSLDGDGGWPEAMRDTARCAILAASALLLAHWRMLPAEAAIAAVAVSAVPGLVGPVAAVLRARRKGDK